MGAGLTARLEDSGGAIRARRPVHRWPRSAAFGAVPEAPAWSPRDGGPGRAGYAPKAAYAQGYRLLKNVQVAEDIQRAVNARAKRLDATLDRLVQETMRIATADIRDVVRVEGAAVTDEGEVIPGGVRVIPSDEWSDDAAAAVAEVAETAHGLRIKMHPKHPALDLLAKHLGIYKSDGVPLEEVTALVKALARATEPFVQEGDLQRLAKTWTDIVRTRGGAQ